MDDKIKAAVFDRLIAHLQAHTEVQNIDLMIAGGFCRNCFHKWYKAASEELGQPISKEEAQLKIYGMPYQDWKEKYQTEATPEQMAAFEKVHETMKGE